MQQNGTRILHSIYLHRIMEVAAMEAVLSIGRRCMPQASTASALVCAACPQASFPRLSFVYAQNACPQYGTCFLRSPGTYPVSRLLSKLNNPC